MATPTRQRLIDAAITRFYRDGFRNVGIDQILDDVGISKTAFYKHFESKEDLMLAGLQQQDQWLRDTFTSMVQERGGDSAIGQLRAVFDVIEEILSRPDFAGCIFVNAAMEFPLPHEPAHIAAAQNKHAIEEIVTDLARRAGANHPQIVAEELCMVIEGAYVTRQVTGKESTIDIARRIAERVISDYCRQPGEGA